MSRTPIKILQIYSSIRGGDSASTRLADEAVKAIAGDAPASVVTRNLSDGVPLIDAEWAVANSTPAEQRSGRQTAVLGFSEALIGEIEQADVIVIGVGLYNFSIPAALKAWIDLVSRARRTFRYTESGPEGLLKGKRAVIAFASGGVEAGSAADFATGYLKFALGFIGIDDVDVIASDAIFVDKAGSERRAEQGLKKLARDFETYREAA